MNSIIRDVINKTKANVKKYDVIGNSIIYTDYDNNKYVAKKYNNDLIKVYGFLKTRNFTYIPKIIFYDNGYIYKYLNDYIIPDDKRMYDIIKIAALLHSKTVYFKDLSLDDVKAIYEDITQKINEAFKYYDDLIEKIEKDEFISPSGYLLLRNCSLIFSCISFSKQTLESWYNDIKEKRRVRKVLIHNNLDTDHIIEEEKPILISWDKAIIDIPIYDFIKLYKQNYDRYDFVSLYKEYNKIFPLTDDETKLFYTILFIPDIIDFKASEFINSTKLSKLFNYLLTTNDLFMKNQAKKSEKQNDNIDKENKSVQSNT